MRAFKICPCGEKRKRKRGVGGEREREKGKTPLRANLMDPRTPQPAKQCQFERQLIYERYGYSSIEPRMLRLSIKPRLIHRRYGDLSIEPRMHRLSIKPRLVCRRNGDLSIEPRIHRSDHGPVTLIVLMASCSSTESCELRCWLAAHPTDQ